MADRICPQCGAPVDPGATECRFCGEKMAVAQAAQQVQQPQYQQPQYQQPQYQQPQYQQPLVQQPQYQQPQYQQPRPQYQQPMYQQSVYVTGINPSWPIKNKVVAGILAIFFGWIGVHKFYLGQIGTGIIYLLFCWTGIPGIIGFIEGLIYLCSNDENFMLKNHVRIG